MREIAEAAVRRFKHHACHLLAASALLLTPVLAHAEGAAVGVNVINPYVLPAAEQDAMLDAIHASGVSVIRISITLDDKGVDYAERAWKRGIKVEWLIYRFGGYDPFGTVPLSRADPDRFRAAFAPILARLEAKGITLAGFELGNEINLSGTNPEFDAPHNRARQLGPADLERDPEGQRVAAGLRQYLTALAALKDMRDRSKLNRNTPILTAGLGTYDQDDGPLPSWAKADVVSIHTTLGYLRAHGLDRLVDAYAVHIYPDTKHDGADAPAARKQRIAAYDLADCRPPGSPGGKPCWITEWGIDNPSVACPPDDGRRARLLREIMADFRPYVRDGAVAGLLYFAWNTTPQSSALLASSLWRCGALTEAGRLAIDATVLR